MSASARATATRGVKLEPRATPRLARALHLWRSSRPLPAHARGPRFDAASNFTGPAPRLAATVNSDGFRTAASAPPVNTGRIVFRQNQARFDKGRTTATDQLRAFLGSEKEPAEDPFDSSASVEQPRVALERGGAVGASVEHMAARIDVEVNTLLLAEIWHLFD